MIRFIYGASMNLQEFISHRKHCPICDEQLKVFFHSIKKQQYI